MHRQVYKLVLLCAPPPPPRDCSTYPGWKQTHQKGGRFQVTKRTMVAPAVKERCLVTNTVVDPLFGSRWFDSLLDSALTDRADIEPLSVWTTHSATHSLRAAYCTAQAQDSTHLHVSCDARKAIKTRSFHEENDKASHHCL